VVRWRLIDLAQWIFEDYRISVTKQILSRELRAMGYRKLSARPRHHAQDAAAVAAFKNVWPAPFASDFAIWSGESATTYPVSGPSAWPRWSSAHPGPYKTYGISAPNFKPGSRTPVDCQAILLPSPANIAGFGVL
jgi:hypothetical protein